MWDEVIGMTWRSVLVVVVAMGVSLGSAGAQGSSAVPQPKPLVGSVAGHVGWPKGKAEDVSSIDGLMAALYDVISGPAGKPRDWDRFRSLFAPDGRLGIVRVDHPAVDGQPAKPGDVYFLTPDMYVERDAPFFAKEGFFEHGIANRVEQFGNLVSVWSTYESRHAPEDAKPFARGINSIQLVKAQGRWWIASILWEDEREGLALPEKYLKP